MTEKKYTIGIDVGGTKMSAVLYDGDDILADDLLATPKDNLDHFLVMINALVENMERKASELKVKVDRIGLSIAGTVDGARRKVLNAPNIPIVSGVNLADLLEERINKPVSMDHDMNCFLLAEIKKGGGRKYQNVYAVTVSTGIGGAWWYNGEVYRGAHCGAGEPGEMIMEFGSKISLEESYQKMTQNNPAAMAEKAFRGDILAEKTFHELGDYLGVALANIVNIIDPEVIIVTGGVMESSELFLGRIKKTMKEYIVSEESGKKIKIIKSKLGANGCAIGAAILATQLDD
ncbi:MAG: ROK family protein [bacterium]